MTLVTARAKASLKPTQFFVKANGEPTDTALTPGLLERKPDASPASEPKANNHFSTKRPARRMQGRILHSVAELERLKLVDKSLEALFLFQSRASALSGCSIAPCLMPLKTRRLTVEKFPHHNPDLIHYSYSNKLSPESVSTALRKSRSYHTIHGIERSRGRADGALLGMGCIWSTVQLGSKGTLSRHRDESSFATVGCWSTTVAPLLRKK